MPLNRLIYLFQETGDSTKHTLKTLKSDNKISLTHSPMERKPQERVKSVNNITKVVDFGAKFWSILKIRYKQQFSN